ncbi:MAG: hypothetical protein F4Y45_06095 [Acidobacteria bacterium]|nr:hypothetical protein [Acidobacteriota bacterium]MYJ03412.1 hypothetical protein [Acidobacteriota bacterium]
MLSGDRSRELFVALDWELAKRSVVGEVGLLGGAVMCLVFRARDSTKDVAALFAPTREIRDAAVAVARAFGIPDDWLNDAAKGFVVSSPPRLEVLELPNLRVWAPTADYMLAMKCVSARFDTHDADDVAFLVRHLELATPDEVFERITRYYPHGRVPPKTRFLVEELLSQGN